MSRFKFRPIALACALCAIAACTPGAPVSAGNNTSAATASATDTSSDTNAWVNNGATACEKYLTADVVGAIFKDANGQSKKQDSQGCVFEAAHRPDSDFSTIYIYLQNGSPDTFDMNSSVKNGTPIQGVGDKAVRTNEDGVHAIKGDRLCIIFVKPPNGNKLKGDALAQKLGEVCNKLFALP